MATKTVCVILNADGRFFDNMMGVWRNDYADASLFDSREGARELTLNDPRVKLQWARIVSGYGTAEQKTEFLARGIAPDEKPADEKPSPARLALSRSRRLRALVCKAWRSQARYSKKGNTEEARQARLDGEALQHAADMLRDWALTEAKRTGEALS